ncbi:MAG: hypothetical protein K8I03_03865 [Ignavibacteria bacterium]|nr:hypothetical protein [Ignavibacteria bacterium]
MTTTSLKSSISKRIRNFPKDKLLVVEDFVSYLAERSDNPATKELLRIPGLLSEINAAKKEFASGKGIDWRKVRSDV